jgi:hypothetical protein
MHTDVTSTNAATPVRPLTKRHTPDLAIIDRDSIYWSKERWRIIPQRLGKMSIQYLLIDAHHNEIVAQYRKMSEAMAHRDRLDPGTV